VTRDYIPQIVREAIDSYRDAVNAAHGGDSSKLEAAALHAETVTEEWEKAHTDDLVTVFRVLDSLRASAARVGQEEEENPPTIGYVYNDGGRADTGRRGMTGDCVARAIAIASGRPYAEVYAALAEGNKAQRVTKHTRGKRRANAKTASHGINVTRQWFKDYMRGLGFEWVATMRIGSGCTVHLNASELPAGRLVVSVSKHYTAVIDGVIHDTWNPSERGTTIYPPGYVGTVPAGAVWLENGNGWAYSPERCVYGYWIFKG
jgi:hypothetical protein